MSDSALLLWSYRLNGKATKGYATLHPDNVRAALDGLFSHLTPEHSDMEVHIHWPDDRTYVATASDGGYSVEQTRTSP